MFGKIENPQTGNWVKVNSTTGKRILANCAKKQSYSTH